LSRPAGRDLLPLFALTLSIIIPYEKRQQQLFNQTIIADSLRSQFFSFSLTEYLLVYESKKEWKVLTEQARQSKSRARNSVGCFFRQQCPGSGGNFDGTGKKKLDDEKIQYAKQQK
jgi:hypothetical protein